MKRILSICILLLSAFVMMEAEVIPAPIFADNMVLQQEADAALWGKAEPDSKVTITPTWSRIKTVVRAGEDGKWFARIRTPKAGGPYEITFDDGGKKVSLKNVLIGEVWICSGQSNMEMPMEGFMGQPVDGSAELISEADPSIPIRSCTLKNIKSFDPQDECGAIWYVNDPKGVSQSSATAYFFALKLYKSLRVPVGVINCSWGGSPIEAWMNPELLRKEFAGEISLEHLDTRVWPEPWPFKAAGVLYNGMLHSLIPLTAKGFIWYQGCDNRTRYEQYKRLQPAFVNMLRQEWGNDRMPFYFTQIAPYCYDDPDAPEGGFMMWAQAQTLEMIPYSGMAATHDAGDKYCIHPSDKKAVGDRLAYLALANDYGVEGFDANPPVPSAFHFEGGVAYVNFDCGRQGLSPIYRELGGFELAGEDRVFHSAQAWVAEDLRSLKVFSPDVPAPVAIRYGMKNWSEPTLFNSFGIPASPFRSDDWK